MKNQLIWSENPNVKVFSKKQWLDWKDYTIQFRAMKCLQHFINEFKLWNWLKILEVWPFPINMIINLIDDFNLFKSPISIFEKKIPWNTYLWLWPHNWYEKHTKTIMWEVDFIDWIIDLENEKKWIHQVLDYFKWKPDIIYWRHVFENSNAEKETFPIPRSYMLEWTVKLLRDWGFLIVDNASWYKWNILRLKGFYSKELKLVSEYYYDKTWKEWIFIFQKPLWTDKKVYNKVFKQRIQFLVKKI